jgi:hypothetical protein
MKKLLFIFLLATTVFLFSAKIQSSKNITASYESTSSKRISSDHAMQNSNIGSPKILLMVTRQDKSSAMWWSYENSEMEGC